MNLEKIVDKLDQSTVLSRMRLDIECPEDGEWEDWTSGTLADVLDGVGLGLGIYNNRICVIDFECLDDTELANDSYEVLNKSGVVFELQASTTHEKLQEIVTELDNMFDLDDMEPIEYRLP